MTRMSFAPRSTARSRYEVAASDLARTEDHRKGGGGGDGLRDRHVVVAGPAEHHALAVVEVGGRHVQLAGEAAEVVGATGLVERIGEVGLEWRAVVEPRGQALGHAEYQVHRSHRPDLARELAGQAHQAQGH
jgi:hypothetical protein